MRIAPLVLTLALAVPMSLPAESATAKPDFSSFAFIQGTWSCKVTKSSDLKSVGLTYPFVVTADPGGYWYVAKSPHSKRYLTHDAKTAKWVSTDLTDDGGSYSSSAPGWSGKKIIFADTFNSDGSPLASTTLTKMSAKEYTIHSVEPTAKGPDVYDETCTKP
jgi:hypothetical protein